MKEQLIGILGLKKDSTDKEILLKVSELRNDLDGKMGFAHSSIMGMMKRLGYFKFDQSSLTWFCRPISDDEMNKILKY